MTKKEPIAEEANRVITLSALAMELKIYRSKLDYYMSLGLITPMNTIGLINFFDKQATVIRLKEINKLQKGGKTLKEISEILKKVGCQETGFYVEKSIFMETYKKCKVENCENNAHYKKGGEREYCRKHYY